MTVRRGILAGKISVPDAAEWTFEKTDVRQELAEHHDLPELADSMEEAEARAKASTFLRVLGHVEKEFEANKAELAKLIEYYTEQHYIRQQKLERQAKWIKEILEGFFGMMDAGKRKSLNLLGGQLGHRKQKDELVVKDEEVVVEWSNEFPHADVLRITKTLDRKELRLYMETEQHGGHPPGVELVERPDVFFASPK